MKLDTRITLQHVAESTSASGSVSSVPETIGEVWANVRADGSREAEKSAEQSVTFTVRASPATLKLEPRDRVTWKGKTYAIGGIQAEHLRVSQLNVLTLAKMFDDDHR